MGISVHNHHVTVNTSDKNGVIISATDNPRRQRVKGHTIYSIFARTPYPDQTFSDGNPLIHALKGNKGYTTDRNSLILLRDEGIQIASTFINKIFQPDAIMSLPSSSNLNRTFASRLSRVSQSVHLNSCLDKTTIGKIRNNHIPINSIPRNHRNSYRTELNTILKGSDPDIFKIKAISFRTREYFEPLILNTAALQQINTNSFSRLLLIDDLIASGTSLISGLKIIQEQFPNKEIVGLTMFSQTQSKKT